MKAMILAAGKGTRLQPLTNTCPKPLIKVAGKPLIEYHLESLKKSGFTDIVINVHYLGEQIIDALGTGEKWGMRFCYSKESTLLETGGGICTALPLLGQNPFVLVNADIWTDFDFSTLPQTLHTQAHLILVDNPSHHPEGDFTLLDNGFLKKATNRVEKTYTYAGIAVLHPSLFTDCAINTPFKLSSLFDQAQLNNELSGEYYSGAWTDVGDVSRLHALEKMATLSTI